VISQLLVLSTTETREDMKQQARQMKASPELKHLAETAKPCGLRFLL